MTFNFPLGKTVSIRPFQAALAIVELKSRASRVTRKTPPPNNGFTLAYARSLHNLKMCNLQSRER